MLFPPPNQQCQSTEGRHMLTIIIIIIIIKITTASYHWVQSMNQVAYSFLNSVTSLLFSRATTEKSAFYFSDSPF